MVVQCPTCESKFRIADDKVTDRGVRVRCTSCKNVFQVRKPGGTAEGDAPGPGQTTDLSSLSAKQLGKAKGPAAGAGSPATAKPSTGPVRPGASRPPSGPIRSPATKPPTGPVRPAAARPATGPVRPTAGARPPTGPVRPATDAAARRLDTDDLFGMDELTGDAPAADREPSQPIAVAKPAAKPMPDFDALELDTDLTPPSPAAAAPIPAPESSTSSGERLELDETRITGKVKTGPVLGSDQNGARPPTPRPPSKKMTTGPIAVSPPAAAQPASDPQAGAARALVSSALTGVLGASLAICVVVISALKDDSAASWLGVTPASDLVATSVVSGLYDTASGKAVFFIRGRIENHGQRPRGPVRVTAELVSGGSAEGKAETLAGAEPSPEDVYSVRTADDAAKLTRKLDSAKVARKLQPGDSIPFFAVITDPPADLVRHRLHLKVESVDAWHPPAPQASKAN